MQVKALALAVIVDGIQQDLTSTHSLNSLGQLQISNAYMMEEGIPGTGQTCCESGGKQTNATKAARRRLAPDLVSVSCLRVPAAAERAGVRCVYAHVAPVLHGAAQRMCCSQRDIRLHDDSGA